MLSATLRATCRLLAMTARIRSLVLRMTVTLSTLPWSSKSSISKAGPVPQRHLLNIHGLIRRNVEEPGWIGDELPCQRARLPHRDAQAPEGDLRETLQGKSRRNGEFNGFGLKDLDIVPVVRRHQGADSGAQLHALPFGRHLYVVSPHLAERRGQVGDMDGLLRRHQRGHRKGRGSPAAPRLPAERDGNRPSVRHRRGR